MLEYPFFLYKEKPGAAFSFSPEGRFPFGRTVSADWPSESTLERCAAVTGLELDAALDSDPLLVGLPAKARLHKFRYLSQGNGGRFAFETVGATVKMPVREHERLFAALLGVAQTHRYSLVDPLFGMLPHGAGVDDNHIRRLLLPGKAVAHLFEDAGKLFAVSDI